MIEVNLKIPEWFLYVIIFYLVVNLVFRIWEIILDRKKSKLKKEIERLENNKS